MLKIIALTGLIGVTAAHAQQKDAAPVSPVVKKTVDAFVGRWSFVGIDAEPGAKAAKLTMAIDCEIAARGAAVACTFTGQSVAVGRIEAAAVIGYSPDEKVVRWMEISSTGEYHDHRGIWKGDTIEFEALPYTISGRRAVEELSIRFPAPGRLMLQSVTKTTEGSSTFEGSAERK